MTFPRRVFFCAVLLALAGCATMPVGSLVQLARVDVMTTDLDQLRAALWLPAELQPLPGAAVLTVTVRRAGSADETLALALVASAAPAQSTAGLPSEGHSLVYRLGDADKARLDAVRRDILERKRPGSLTLAVGISQFCRTGTIPAGPLYASSYLSTAETGAFVPLLERFDLRSDPRLAAAFDAVPPC